MKHIKKGKQHSFDILEAEKYGIKEAILLANIRHWLDKNKANKTNINDGRVWTYNSYKAFAELFPYMSVKQIRTALNKLIDAGILITGNYNKAGYDKTLWYTIDEPEYVANGDDQEGNSNGPNGQAHVPKRAEPFAHTGTPIPDSKPDSKPNVNTLSNAREGEREVQKILDKWNDIYECQLRLTKGRINKIRARLKNETADNIITAMRNRSANKYWRTKEGKPHRNNFDSFIRSDEQVDKYLNQEATHTYTSKEKLPF